MRTRREIIDLSTRDLLPNALAARVCRALSHTIPNDGYRLFGLDPASQLINRTLAASDSDTAARHEWLQSVYLSHQSGLAIDFSNTIGAGISLAAYHEVLDDCYGLPQTVKDRIEPNVHRRLYHETGTPAGGVIFANFGSRGQWLATLQLYRRDNHGGFRRGEVSFLQLIAPIIGHALAAAFSRERAAMPVPSRPGASGVWLLDLHGRLCYQSPAAEQWNHLLRRTDRNDASPVPTAVQSAVASLRHGGPVSVLTPTVSGPVLVEASIGGGDGSVAVVLTPQRPPSLPELPHSWGLTLQEQQVVELLIQGKSNSEIARQLASSERTIESHLSHVYAKLEVRGRAEVIARFFWQTYLPSIDHAGIGSSTVSFNAALDSAFIEV